MTSSIQRPRHRRRSNLGFHSGPRTWTLPLLRQILKSLLLSQVKSDFLYRDVPNWHGDELHLMKKKKHILIFIRNIFTCQALRADTFNFFFYLFPPKVPCIERIPCLLLCHSMYEVSSAKCYVHACQPIIAGTTCTSL